MPALPPFLYAAADCGQRHEIGLEGRITIHEIMVCDDDIQAKIMEREDTRAIRKAALSAGMTLMVQDGLEKVSQGLVQLGDVLWRTGRLEA